MNITIEHFNQVRHVFACVFAIRQDKLFGYEAIKVTAMDVGMSNK